VQRWDNDWLEVLGYLIKELHHRGAVSHSARTVAQALHDQISAGDEVVGFLSGNAEDVFNALTFQALDNDISGLRY
jgi:hypothetical protein